MKDRVSKYPGRVKLTPVDGQENTFDMVRADEPIEIGTPLNKGNLLSDQTADMYKLEGDPSVDDAFKKVISSIASDIRTYPVAEGQTIKAGETVDIVDGKAKITYGNGARYATRVLSDTSGGYSVSYTMLNDTTAVILCDRNNTNVSITVMKFDENGTIVQRGSTFIVGNEKGMSGFPSIVRVPETNNQCIVAFPTISRINIALITVSGLDVTVNDLITNSHSYIYNSSGSSCEVCFPKGNNKEFLVMCNPYNSWIGFLYLKIENGSTISVIKDPSNNPVFSSNDSIERVAIESYDYNRFICCYLKSRDTVEIKPIMISNNLIITGTGVVRSNEYSGNLSLFTFPDKYVLGIGTSYSVGKTRLLIGEISGLNVMKPSFELTYPPSSSVPVYYHEGKILVIITNNNISTIVKRFSISAENKLIEESSSNLFIGNLKSMGPYFSYGQILPDLKSIFLTTNNDVEAFSIELFGNNYVSSAMNISSDAIALSDSNSENLVSVIYRGVAEIPGFEKGKYVGTKGILGYFYENNFIDTVPKWDWDIQYVTGKYLGNGGYQYFNIGFKPSAVLIYSIHASIDRNSTLITNLVEKEAFTAYNFFFTDFGFVFSKNTTEINRNEIVYNYIAFR